MKRTLLSIIWVLLTACAMAQTFGNEWIHYDQRYWAFKVWTDGFYRIDSTTLANAGFPLGSVDARNIQVFAREREVPLHVVGEADGVLNTSDYIEFYGLRNDGWLDSSLWDTPEHINNPFYSLYNDTIQYFITWRSDAPGARVREQGPGNYQAYPAQPYCFGSALTQWADTYQGGKRTKEEASYAAISEGEGYFSPFAINTDNTPTLDIYHATQQLYQGPDAPDATYELVMASANNPGNGGCPNHHVQLFNGALLVDTVFTGYQLNHFTVARPASGLVNGNNVFHINVPHDLATGSCPNLDPTYPDAHVVAWSRLTYPRTFDLGSSNPPFLFDVPGNTSGDSIHIAFTWSAVPKLYAWSNGAVHLVTCVQDGGFWHAVLEPSVGPTRISFAHDFYILPISAPHAVNGNGVFVDPAQNLTDSAMVIISHPTLMEGAMQYAQFRETSPHNRYNTMLADVEDLYLQFGGGVRKHPLAIKRYLRYVYTHAPSRPKAVFLIGKSVQCPTVGADHGYRVIQNVDAVCLVPTIGFPSSDMSFTLDLDPSLPNEMAFPVGRLAARTNADVLNYMAKVDSVEGQKPAKWMKNILHFRGGFGPDDYIPFDAALESFKTIAEDTCFSGRVIKFVKNGPNVIQAASADSVSNLISEGVTLMTTFAHAFAGGFDITIDNPSNYNWHGKFPTMIGNSCYVGDIHLWGAASASEQFVLPANAGAIAFISSVDVGLANQLRQYTEYFYRSFSRDNYGKSIGTHMQYAVKHQLQDDPSVYGFNSAEAMTLHGDPTIIMNSPPLPDLEITPADVKVSPDPVTANTEEFTVKAVVRNIGRGTHMPFSVALQRTLIEEGITLPAIIQQMSLTHFEDSVTFTVPTLASTGGAGLNDLQVRVDQDPSIIPEIEDNLNNSVTSRIQITSGDLLPIDPYDFAITPDHAPLLQASTGDPFLPARNYVFQIDTTDLYNSPLAEEGTVNAAGGVVEWQPSGIYSLNNTQDSVVYYWRCALDSAGKGQYNWHEFSFQHLTNRHGWGQSHFFQFKNDAFNEIIYNRPQRRFDYFSGSHSISSEVWGNSLTEVQWSKDLEPQEGLGCSDKPSLMVGVVDPFDFSTWLSRYQGVGRYFGNVNDNGNCRERQERYFIFREAYADQMQGMDHMITDSIPDGHLMVVYTYLYLNKDGIQAGSPTLIQHLGDLGATNLANGTVPDTVPYIFICRKGDPASAVEVWGQSLLDHIDTTVFFNFNDHSGAITAPRSSTALNWENFSWRTVPQQAYDSTRMNLIRVAPTGVEQAPIPLSGYSGNLDLQPLISAVQYPQLRIKGDFWNDSAIVSRPSQTKRWQLIGAPAPECAIDPPSGVYEHLDSLFEGEQAAVMITINNVSDVNMDSLLVAAWVVDQNNVKHLVHYKRNVPLAAGAMLRDTVRFSTEPFPGANTFIVEANPVDTTTHVYDQPEQYHFNNIATLRFNTIQDRQNPVLDVTFDGIHILDGDIVSARPEIQVTLDDENRILLLDSPADTAYYKFYLTDPTGAQKQLYFRQGGQQILQFIPATGPANVSKVLYHPVFAMDGVYTLTSRGADISHNNSGDHDLSVRFEVINKPTITEVLNYPNPFTTSTRFVFTLTGSEIPTAMRVQIMTISGRVVREVGMAELGPMHVGRNITDFAWDGTDQFGDRLGRGVYLYHVVAQLHGQDIEYRETSAGSYFTKGFGKMYLLR